MWKNGEHSRNRTLPPPAERAGSSKSRHCHLRNNDISKPTQKMTCATPNKASKRRPNICRREICLLAWALLTSSSAFGAGWHGNVSFVSDYQYRGYTKSRSAPVVQGRLDFDHESGWYAGAAVSQVGFDDKPSPDRAHFEARPYLGWALGLSPDWQADLTASGYLYDGRVFDQSAHYAEISGAVTFRNWLTGRIALAPDAYQRNCDVLTYETQARYDLLDNLQLSAGLGFHQAAKLLDHDYFYWNSGLTWYPTNHLSFDFRYMDAQIQAAHEVHEFTEFYPRPIENKWVLSVSLGF